VSETRQACIGAERWLSVHDDLLRSLAHAISNRLATIVAAASVLDAGAVPDARLLDGLRGDADRLEGLLQQLRQLPRHGDAALEPMLFTDALDGAKRLVEEHPLLRGRELRVVSRGDVVPVRAEPGALQHAIAVALLAAARVGPGPIEAELETVGDDVRLTARHDGAAADGDPDGIPLAHDVLAMEWLLASSNGRATAHSTGCTVAVPTLQASRRRAG